MKITGKTQAEVDVETTTAMLKAERAELTAQCDAYDLKAIRPLRAIAAGAGTDNDRAKVSEIEAAVAPIRVRIKELDTLLGTQ